MEKSLISLNNSYQNQYKYHNKSNLSFGAKLTVLNQYTPKPKSALASARDIAEEEMKNGNFNAAINSFKQALNLDPNDFDSHLGIAKAYTYNGQHAQSISHFEAYLKSAPEDIENITMLGEAYKKTGMYDKAKDYFKKALAIEPRYDYAKRNLLDTQNLELALTDPQKAQKERYDTAINNLTQAVKIAGNFLPSGYTNSLKDVSVSFDKTSKMGGRSNIAQYEHAKRKISVTEEYTYADPKLTGAYLVHEFVHASDNDPYTSIREEQDAYAIQAKYWTQNVKNICDPEMDYVADLYRQSAETLEARVSEIYRLRDPEIAETSRLHPPTNTNIAGTSLSDAAGQPLKAYDIIV